MINVTTTRTPARAHRAAAVTRQFTAKNPTLDFSKLSALRASAAGETDLIDLATMKPDPAAAQRRERAQRLDRLPPAIQALNANLSIEALEALAFVQSASAAAGGQPSPVNRGDLARAMRTTPDAAGAILSDLARRGFVKAVKSFGGVPVRYKPQI